MSDEIEVFLNKIDAFAEGLDETEQAMLAHLIQDEPDDVVGFSGFMGGPSKAIDIAPVKIGDLRGFLSSGHTGNFTATDDLTHIISGGANKGEM